MRVRDREPIPSLTLKVDSQTLICKGQAWSLHCAHYTERGGHESGRPRAHSFLDLKGRQPDPDLQGPGLEQMNNQSKQGCIQPLVHLTNGQAWELALLAQGCVIQIVRPRTRKGELARKGCQEDEFGSGNSGAGLCDSKVE